MRHRVHGHRNARSGRHGNGEEAARDGRQGLHSVRDQHVGLRDTRLRRGCHGVHGQARELFRAVRAHGQGRAQVRQTARQRDTRGRGRRHATTDARRHLLYRGHGSLPGLSHACGRHTRIRSARQGGERVAGQGLFQVPQELRGQSGVRHGHKAGVRGRRR